MLEHLLELVDDTLVSEHLLVLGLRLLLRDVDQRGVRGLTGLAGLWRAPRRAPSGAQLRPLLSEILLETVDIEGFLDALLVLPLLDQPLVQLNLLLDLPVLLFVLDELADEELAVVLLRLVLVS